MRYVLLTFGGVLLSVGCTSLEQLERQRAETKCPEGQVAVFAPDYIGDFGPSGMPLYDYRIACQPKPAPSTQSPTPPALSESQRR